MNELDLLPPVGGLRELALFAGAGGGILGGHLLGWRTVCAVECEVEDQDDAPTPKGEVRPNSYARDVLVARQDDGLLQPFPIWDDVRTFDGSPWRGRVDVVSGGFLAHADSRRFEGLRISQPEGEQGSRGSELDRRGREGRLGRPGTEVPDADEERREARQGLRETRSTVRRDPQREPGPRGIGRPWPAEPDVGRVAHGLAARVDRLRATGNGQVPRVAAAAFELLRERGGWET